MSQGSASKVIVHTSQRGSGVPQTVKGLSEVAGRYKALLLDQFGVLHDGRRPYPGAVEAVAAAAAAGLRLLIISNSSRRAGGTLDKLAAMGFDRAAFTGVVTSGELTHRYLTTRPDDWWAGLGSRVLHLNWSRRGPASLEGYGLQVVTDPRDADFILAHGTEGLSLPGGGVQERPLEELKQLLLRGVERAGAAAAGGEERPQADTTAAGRAPPLVVANPDVVTVDGDDLVPMPGALAAAYSGAGGPVVLMGKPSPLIYAAAGEMLGLPPRELLAVGDSLEHDIAGAAAAGIDSLFVAGGIHARELLPQPPQQPPHNGQLQPPQGHQPSEQRAASSGAPGASYEQQGPGEVDMGALRQLVAAHLGATAGGGGAGGGEEGAGRGFGAGAPTYVVTRFVW